MANSGSNTVSQFTISPTNGSLAPMATATATTELNPTGLVVEPTGRFVYVANFGSNTVSQFRIGAGGALTAIAVALASNGTTPTSLATDAAGRYAYVSNLGSNTVAQYTISPTNGSLAPMGIATVNTAINPTGLARR